MSPLGIVKSNTAALVLHELVTLAEVQAPHVVVDHTVIVAAVQVSPLAPFGIVKSNTAAAVVQELVTLAEVHGSHVVVVHTVTVAAAHVAHVSPLSHFRVILASSKTTVPVSSLVKTISSPLKAALTILAHVSHFSHSGIVKLNTAAQLVPELVTLAELHGSHVVVLQTVIVAASPLSHFAHVSPVSHLSPLSHLYHLTHCSPFSHWSHFSHCIP